MTDRNATLEKARDALGIRPTDTPRIDLLASMYDLAYSAGQVDAAHELAEMARELKAKQDAATAQD